MDLDKNINNSNFTNNLNNNSNQNQFQEEIKSMMDNLDYENAKEAIEFYLKKDENNCVLLEYYSEVLIQLDDIEKAEKV